jgi:hypothetical protein
MFDRQWLGDLVLAVLLAIPTAAVAATGHEARHNVISAAEAQSQGDHSAVDNRFSLFAPN